MKTQQQRLPVSERALLARVNRALAKRDEMLKRSRQGSRTFSYVGRYFTIDVRLNGVIRDHLDLEEFARELGVMADYETLSADED